MRRLFFKELFTGDAWVSRARVEIDSAGMITVVEGEASPEGCEVVAGCGVPGVPNLHSHAHQRAMAGLAERSGAGEDSLPLDSFWTWREVMYRHVERMTPEDLEAVAAQLYVEMLEAGFTAVGEFQYLHHGSGGEPYDEIAEMSLRCLAAARQVGIGITSLPVLYAQGGFGGLPAGSGQRRFLNGAEGFLRIVEALEGEADAGAAVGIAPHSLRAVPPELMGEVLQAFGGRGPVHVHVAEQVKEVEDCLAWSGRRPVEWLLEHGPVDTSWCLIHATHMTCAETRALAATGAVAGLCPTTEANLGDGFFNAVEYLAAGGRVGIGSDSNSSVSPVEEVRWLEYGQRLRHHGRNLLAGGADRSTGRRLLQAVLEGGAQACGRPIGALRPGCRGDLVVLDTDHPLLWERSGDAILDGWIFAGNEPLVREVLVGGRTVVKDGRHVARDEIRGRYRQCLKRLRGGSRPAGGRRA